jgi:multiple antibiotic resistance protein
MDVLVHVLRSLMVVPLALLPVINPMSSAPVFVATTGRSPETAEQLARQVAKNSWYVIVISIVAGAQVLSFFGLSLPIVRVAGGLLVAFTGWRMLNSSEQDEVVAAAAQKAVPLTEAEIMRRSFFPLTFPLTTGPGTIAASIALGAQVLPRSPVQVAIDGAIAAGGAALTAFLLYLIFKHAASLLDRLGDMGMLVLMRMMAFILLCIGIQFIFTGWMELKIAVPGLT